MFVVDYDFGVAGVCEPRHFARIFDNDEGEIVSNRFQVLVWAESPFYVAKCLDLNLAGLGKTPDEAVDRLNAALASFLLRSDEIIDKKEYELRDIVL